MSDRRPLGAARLITPLAAVIALAMLVPPLPVMAGPPPHAGDKKVEWSPVHPGQDDPFDKPSDIEVAGANRPDPTRFPPAPVGAGAAARTAEADAAADVSEVAVAVPTPTSIDMEVLVIHTGWEMGFELEGIKGALDRIGIPYDTLNAESVDLTPEMLFDDTGRGHYYAMILTTGNLGYIDGSGSYVYGFDQSEWDLLWAYQAAFGVRQITSYTAPIGFPDTYGLSYVGETGTDDAPMPVTLTTAGHEVFSYLTDAQIPIRYAWVYLATVADPTTVTPLIVSGDHAIASVKTYPDGRENLTLTAAKNDWALHSLLLWGGMIDWATRGVYLGERHVNFDAQIDDLLIDDNLWDPVAMSDETGLTYRMTNADFNTTIAWQRRLGRNPVTSDVMLEMAFNGEGATGVYPKDNLTRIVKRKNEAFSWVNHAYSHLNMSYPEDEDGNPRDEATTYDEALAELESNHEMAAELGLVNYDPSAFVQPDISGLDNPDFLHAAADFGIEYLISDTSRAEWSNPSPNTGIILTEEPRLLIIPRRPSNLFYNLSTPTEWVSEYNCYYGPDATCAGGEWSYWDHDLSYAEILDVESEMLLSYLLKWDIDPLMFHQANLRNYETGHSLLSDLLDATFDKYRTYYRLPVRGLTQVEIGEAMRDRMAFEDAAFTATIVPCESMTLTASDDVTVPVTGVYVDETSTETYGDDLISTVELTAGSSETLSVSCSG